MKVLLQIEVPDGPYCFHLNGSGDECEYSDDGSQCRLGLDSGWIRDDGIGVVKPQSCKKLKEDNQ